MVTWWLSQTREAGVALGRGLEFPLLILGHPTLLEPGNWEGAVALEPEPDLGF